MNIENVRKRQKIKKIKLNEKWQFSSHGEKERSEEHLVPWIKSELKTGIKRIPKKLKRLSLFAAIILGINLIFWSINIYFLPGFLRPFKGLIQFIIFITATYNNIIPKTIFWGIIFTFGRRLFNQIRKRGAKNAFKCMKNTIPLFRNAMKRLKRKGYSLLMMGMGFGLIIANNFASYSRLSGARNKFDKYFVVIVIAFSISYILGEANKTGIFKFIKLASKDFSMKFLKKPGLSDDGVYVVLSGFVCGLILDAPLILIKWMYGGYIVGGVLIIIATGLSFKNKSLETSKG